MTYRREAAGSPSAPGHSEPDKSKSGSDLVIVVQTGNCLTEHL
ncbi:hypothetical protein [Niallia circulans]